MPEDAQWVRLEIVEVNSAMEPVRSAPLSVAAGSQDVIGSGAGVPGLYEKMKLVAQGLALNLLIIGWARRRV